EALAELDPLVARLPEGPPETLNVRGDAYRALGRLDDATSDYRRMIRLKPADPEAYVSLAMVCEQQGRPEQSRKCFEDLVAAARGADPTALAAVYCRRAEFLRDHGDFEAAQGDCDTAARTDPKSALPALVRASVEAARGRHRQAVTDAEVA